MDKPARKPVKLTLQLDDAENGTTTVKFGYDSLAQVPELPGIKELLELHRKSFGLTTHSSVSNEEGK